MCRLGSGLLTGGSKQATNLAGVAQARAGCCLVGRAATSWAACLPAPTSMVVGEGLGVLATQ